MILTPDLITITTAGVTTIHIFQVITRPVTALATCMALRIRTGGAGDALPSRHRAVSEATISRITKIGLRDTVA
ncbi:MAG: hypothetical protein IZT59_03440 [Verrucomicrobia bacterium]|nr:hypothetical protein [Verrucomicrobiota bacterium]